MNDVYCGVLVYAYVGVVMVVVEKLWKGDQAVGRKILHMSMGNIVFLLWLLTSPWTALVIAGSFVVFSLLITHRMQLYFLTELSHAGKRTLFRKAYRKVITKLSLISASDAGNEFGLVYYCVAFTVLAIIFYDRPIIIAAGMLPLACGDGMGAVIGRKFGAHRFAIIDRKSVEGSLAVFAGTAIAVFAGLVFYSMAPAPALWKALIIGVITMIVEALAPRGLDNLAIPASAVIAFLLLGATP